MNEQSAHSNDEQLTNPSKEASWQTAAPARDGGGTTPPPRRGGDPARMDDTGGLMPAAGASPSNTAPANCILTPNTPPSPSFQLLRFGIDSLYLSYPGTLSHEWERDLENLKGIAQSDDQGERATAQVEIGGHLFEVKDKGKGRFPYVLVDNCYHLQIAGARAQTLPELCSKVVDEQLMEAAYS